MNLKIQVKTFFIFFIAAVLLFGCTQIHNEPSFKLESESLGLDDLTFPKALYIHDSLLYIQERPAGNKCLNIYSLNSLKKVAQTGILGKGPGEISMPADIVFDDRNNKFYFSDWGNFKIWEFVIQKMLIQSNYVPENFIPLNKALIPIPELKFYKDNLFAFTSYDHFISFFNMNGEIVDSLEISNPSEIDYWDKVELYSYPFSFDIHPSEDKFVVASTYFRHIECFNFEGELIFKYSTDKNLGNITKAKNEDIYQYVQVIAKEKFIFALYNGKKNLIEKGDNVIPQYAKHVHVFDWKGNLICDLELSDHVFAIDILKDKYIYGIKGDFTEIIRYKIPNL